MPVSLFDTLTLDAPRLTNDGYLVASVRASRTGIQNYGGTEVGKPEMKIVRVYRPEKEVFNKDALASFTSIPVTDDHPPEAVTADNHTKYARGSTGEEVARDGEYMRVPLIVRDAAAIKKVQDGKRELSCGYTCDLDFTAGVTPDGLEYDAIQTNIRGNHLAIVSRARGGSELKIGDEDMPDIKLTQIVRDGVPVEVNDAAKIVIDGLDAKLAKATQDAAKVATDHATEIADLNKKIATLDAENATLKAAQVSDADLDKRVEARAKLISDAKRIGGDKLDVTGSGADIKKRAVLTKLGDAYKDRDAAFFDAAFELQLADAGKTQTDPLRRGIQQIDQTTIEDADKALEDSITDLNSWRDKADAA